MYNLPQFNLSLDLWFAGNTPSGGAADVSGIPGQYYVNSRVPLAVDRSGPPVGPPQQELSFRVPSSWASFFAPFAIIDFVGSNSATYFIVQDCIQMHAGFPNEYQCIKVGKCLADGTPVTASA